MSQSLFVLHKGKISQWDLSHGKLTAVTVFGQRWVSYSADTAKTYWDEWKKDNQVEDGDVYDMLFLSDDDELMDSFPFRLARGKDVPLSRWTLKQLSLLSREKEFADSDIHIFQGTLQHILKSASSANELSFQLRSSLDFSLEQRIFLMLLEKNQISIFEKVKDEFKLKPIDKLPSVRYQVGCINDALLQTEKCLHQEYELKSGGALLMILIENEDEKLNESLNRTGKFLRSIPLSKILKSVEEKMRLRKELLIDEYGVNFDGISYFYCDGKIMKSNFNLCSYTVTGEELVKYGGDVINDVVSKELLF